MMEIPRSVKITAAEINELQELELRLLQPGVRADRRQVMALLAEEFFEIGASGKVYDRQGAAETLALAEGGSVSLHDFLARALEPDLVLVTYRSIRRGPGDAQAQALRSSLWRRTETGWALLFHQGTPAGSAVRAEEYPAPRSSDAKAAITPIGVIHSSLADREEAPRQGREGGAEAWLEVYPDYVDGLDGIGPGSEVILLTWLHRARRDVLKVHPRRNREAPLTGVFATRSPDRPNPLGLHRVKVLSINGNRLKVAPLEAIDGTPVADIKPVLDNGRFLFDARLG